LLSGQARYRSAPSTTLEPVPTETTPSTAPRPLKLAAAVVAAEGLVLAVLGIVEAITIDSDRLVLGLTTAAFLLLYGAALLFVARGLYRTSTWSRGPAVFAQLIQLFMAYSFWGGSTKFVSVILAVAGVAVLVAVFQKASMDALTRDPSEDHPVL
jgi:peptidoglycan/LPS O-acetylase OafA/YrhL